ncbi:hypothetical protein ACWC0C_07340 [Streptomyces sp. NPDC001709]
MTSTPGDTCLFRPAQPGWPDVATPSRDTRCGVPLERSAAVAEARWSLTGAVRATPPALGPVV